MAMPFCRIWRGSSFDVTTERDWMRSNEQHEFPDEHRKDIADKTKLFSMVMLALILMIFLAGVTSVLALFLWPELFGRVLFSTS